MSNILDDVSKTDDQTGAKINALAPHIVVNWKVQRNVIVEGTPDPESEPESDVESSIGVRSGQGEMLTFADYQAASDYFGSLAREQGDEPLRIQINRQDDSDRYAAAAAEEGTA